MAVKRLQQILAKQEAQPGDAVSAANLLLAANADFLVKNPSLVFNPELFLRDDLNKSDLESLQPLGGAVIGEGSFDIEVSGRTGTTAPSWGIFMQAAGFHQVATKRLVPGTITSGPLYHGETITQATSGATGVVVHDTYNGASKLYIHSDTGTFDGTNLVTGGTSGATFTPSGAAAADGFGWIPTSIPLVTFTGTPSVSPIPAGEVLVGGTSGAVVVVNTATSGTGSQTVEVRPLSGIMQASETLAGTTGNVVVSGTPAFAQTRLSTLSMALIEDATAKLISGARMSVRFAAQRGQAMIATFGNITGIPGTPVDQGSIPVTSYTARVPAAFIGVTALFGDDADTSISAMHTPALRSFSLDYNSTIAIQEDATAATGLRGAAEHVARSSTAEMDIHVAPEAQFDWLAKMKAGNPFRGRLEWGSSPNLWSMSFPGAVIERERPGDQGGFATRALSLRLGSRRPDGSDAPSATTILTYTCQ